MIAELKQSGEWVNADEDKQCELLIKKVLQIGSSVAICDGAHYKMLARYLKPEALNDDRFFFMLKRSYGKYGQKKIKKLVEFVNIEKEGQE